MSFLYVIQGSDQGCRFELRESVVSIGRETTNLFQLHDAEVSRRHAEIRRIDHKDVLFDAGSSNGLFVNGRRVRQHELGSGDQIQFGRTLILYTQDEKEAEKDASKSGSIVVEFQANNDNPLSEIVDSIAKDEGTWLFNGSMEMEDVQHDDTWLSKARGHLKMMYHTSLVVSQTLDIDRLLNRMLDLIFDWVNIDHACIMLQDFETKKLVPKVIRGKEHLPQVQPGSIKISQTILDYVLHKEEGVLTGNAGSDMRWDPGGSIIYENIKEAICVPMRGRYGIIGVIYIDTVDTPSTMMLEKDAPSRRLTRDHLKLMGAIAHQAALAVEDTRYYRGMVQAERLAAVGQTVAMFSHDIKNILQGISGGSYLIEKGLEKHDESEIAKGWGIVRKNQGKISDLILDMLTFSKEREPSLAFQDINPVTEEAVELLRGRCMETNTRMTFSPDASIPRFCFDAQQISRAVVNIITNAIDAATEEPARVDKVVAISTFLDNELSKVRLTVEDNGPGMSLEDFDGLFRPFNSTKKGRGTGLGLAVTQKIVHEHNGKVHFSSSSALGGAKVVIELPLLLSDGVESLKTGKHEESDVPSNNVQ